MKRKLIDSFLVATMFLSAFGGGAVLLAVVSTSADLEPNVQLQQNHTEQTPTAIAGNSWGGFGDGGSGEKGDDPPKDGGGNEEGNSWGG